MLSIEYCFTIIKLGLGVYIIKEFYVILMYFKFGNNYFVKCYGIVVYRILMY